MRKLSLCIVLCLLFSSFGTMTFAKGQEKAESISLTINGDVKGVSKLVIENNELMLPVREVSEALGASVGWDSKTKSVTIKINKVDIKIKVGSKTAVINGGSKTLKVPPKIVGSKTFVSLQLVTFCFNNMEIKWDKKTKTVSVNKKKDIQPPEPSETPEPVEVEVTPPAATPTTAIPTPTIDNTPFKVTDVYAKSELTVEVSFNHQLNKTSAEKIENYTIQFTGDSSANLPVSKAELDNSGTKVLLTSSKAQAVGTIYEVVVKYVEDIYGNKIVDFKRQFGGIGQVGRAFAIDLSATTSTSVEFVYNMKLDKASAENKLNYYLYDPSNDQQRTNKIPVAKVELDSTGMRVKITFVSPLETMNIYDIVMENIITSEGKTLAREQFPFVVLPSQK